MREQTIRIRFNSVFSFYQASLKFGDLNRSCNDKDKVNAPALWRGSLLIFVARSRQIPREEISGPASFLSLLFLYLSGCAAKVNICSSSLRSHENTIHGCWFGINKQS